MFSIFHFVVHCAVARLRTTSERLGAAAAYTTVYAGDKSSISHCLFCGVNAAVAPNRQLAEGIFSELSAFHYPFEIVRHFRDTITATFLSSG